MMEGSSFDRDIKPCEPGTEIGQQCLRSRNFVKVPGSKIKNNQTSNRSCIGLSQGCNTRVINCWFTKKNEAATQLVHKQV